MAQEVLIEDIKTAGIIYAPKEVTAYEAAKLMRENQISSVAVLEGKTIAGIVTERDIIHRVICQGQDPKQTKREQIMTAPAQTIDANQTVVDAARQMRRQKTRHLIVTEGREAKGIISERDIIEIDPELHQPGE